MLYRTWETKDPSSNPACSTHVQVRASNNNFKKNVSFLPSTLLLSAGTPRAILNSRAPNLIVVWLKTRGQSKAGESWDRRHDKLPSRMLDPAELAAVDAATSSRLGKTSPVVASTCRAICSGTRGLSSENSSYKTDSSVSNKKLAYVADTLQYQQNDCDDRQQYNKRDCVIHGLWIWLGEEEGRSGGARGCSPLPRRTHAAVPAALLPSLWAPDPPPELCAWRCSLAEDTGPCDHRLPCSLSSH